MQKENIESFEISIKDIIGIFKKNKKIFFLTSGTFFTLAAIVFLFFLTPMYEVTATAEIRKSESPSIMSDPMALLLSSASGTESSIDIDLLKSRKVLNKVIERLNLQMVAVKNNNNMFMYLLRKLFKIEDTSAHLIFSKFPAELRNGDGEIVAGPKNFKLVHGDNKVECEYSKDCPFGSGLLNVIKVGEILKPADFTFHFEDIYTSRTKLVQSLVVFPSESSSLLNFSFVHQSPEMSANILNHIVTAYVEVKKDWQKEDETVKEEYINTVLDRLQKDLDAKSRKMILFQKEKETLVPEIQVEELIKKQEMLKANIEEMNLKASLLRESVKNIKEKPDTPIIIPMIFEDLSFQEALKNHNGLIFTKNELLKNMTAEHPAVLGAQREIEESAGSLELMLNENINTLKKSRDVTARLISMISDDKKELPENLFMFAELKRDIELAEKVFVTLSAKLYQSSIDPNTGILPVRIIDTPDPIVPKSSPKTSIFGLLILFFSLFIGVASVFIKDFFFIVGEKENEKN